MTDTDGSNTAADADRDAAADAKAGAAAAVEAADDDEPEQSLSPEGIAHLAIRFKMVKRNIALLHAQLALLEEDLEGKRLFVKGLISDQQTEVKSAERAYKKVRRGRGAGGSLDKLKQNYSHAEAAYYKALSGMVETRLRRIDQSLIASGYGGDLKALRTRIEDALMLANEGKGKGSGLSFFAGSKAREEAKAQGKEALSQLFASLSAETSDGEDINAPQIIAFRVLQANIDTANLELEGSPKLIKARERVEKAAGLLNDRLEALRPLRETFNAQVAPLKGLRSQFGDLGLGQVVANDYDGDAKLEVGLETQAVQMRPNLMYDGRTVGGLAGRFIKAHSGAQDFIQPQNDNDGLNSQAGNAPEPVAA